MRLSEQELKALITDAKLDFRKKNLYGICPKCGGDEFGISLSENHRFGCFRKKSCGFAGNIFTLLAYLGKDVQEVRPGYTPRAKLENKLLVTDEDYQINLDLEDWRLPFGFKQVDHHPYLEKRGFEQHHYDKYKPGITKIDPRYKDYIIFPIEQFGGNKAYIARSMKSKEEIDEYNTLHKLLGDGKRINRYINSNSDFSKILLGLEEMTNNTDTAILVEGLFDKKNVDDKLLLDTQEEVKCVCTWKCAVSPEQIYLLQQSGIVNIILLYDPDVIGEIKKAAFELEKYFNVWVGYNPTGEDPGDMTQQMFDYVLNNLRTPSQFSSTRVAVRKLVKK